MSILGENIRYLRWKEGISQRELERVCLVGRGFVHNLEMEDNGRRKVGHRMVCKHFGYELEELEGMSLESVVVKPAKRVVGSCEEIEDRLVELGYCVRVKNRFIG